MNRENIIRTAREAGLHIATDVNWMPIIGLEYAEKFASLVASAEREACAKLLEDTADGARKVDPNGFVWQAIQKSAELIQARGQA
jgi:hypothetical protein